MKDNNQLTIEEKVVNALLKKDWHICFAESCTAGLVAAKLANVSGISTVFDASIVTYANQAKVDYLGVDEKAIEQYGVVSEQVALQMAQGVAKRNNAQVGVGISGIAGPTGGSEKKPVGTVCFGFVIGDKEFATTKHFGDIGRQNVRQSSVDYVYQVLEEELNK